MTHKFVSKTGEVSAALRSMSRAHTVYKNQDGEIVPGVTTVLRLIDDQRSLIDWANKLGLGGIDSSEYTANSAKIGTLAHGLISAWLQRQDFDTDTYSADTIKFAFNAFNAFREWLKDSNAEPVAIETSYSCQTFGGTCDLVCRIGDDLVVVDYKTGTYVPKHVSAQLEAYAHLYESATGHTINRLLALHLDRESNRRHETHSGRDPEAWAVFASAVELYSKMKRKGW